MKKMILLIILMLTLIGCGKGEFEGKWVNKDWKEEDEKIQITENGNNNYIVTFLEEGEEEPFAGTEKNGVLKVNGGLFMLDFIIDKSNNDLIMGKNRGKDEIFIQINRKLQKEIEAYVEKFKLEIIGEWTEEKGTRNLKGEITKNLTICNLKITPTDEKNIVNIQTTIIKNKGEKEETITTSEGIFIISPSGRILLKENKGRTSDLFLDNDYNVEDIKGLKNSNKKNQKINK